MPTRAMLLTAGLGERMLPLTAGIPKPSLPVLGRPLVVQLLRWLQGCEPQWVVLNLHHHGGDIQRLLGSDTTNMIAQVTFGIDISIFLVINISFSESWQETRQLA